MSVITTENDRKSNCLITEDMQVHMHLPEDFIDYTEEEERAVVRKIDMFVLPLMCFVFLCQYLDKQVLSYTAVVGLIEDLQLTGNQYSWFTSAFYIAQLASQFWNSFALSKFPIKLVTGISILLWGGTCMCLGATNNFQGFVAVRAILGFFEAAVSPAFVIITSVYYRKKEHALRTACWISCNAIAQILAIFIVYGLNQNTHLSLAVWKVTYLVCGGLTIFFGILFIVLIPLHPSNAWFLSERERHIAVNRILAESDRGEKSTFNMRQIIQSLKFDWITISSFFFGFLVTATSGPIVFASLIVEEMGFSPNKILLYGAPSGAVQLLLIWVGVIILYFFPKQRCLALILLSSVPLVGTILLFALPELNHWGRIVASWLASCITSIMTILLSLNASNTRGNTRKAVVNNTFFIGYCLAAIIGPQWWNYSKDPTYHTGLTVNIVFWGVFEVFLIGYRYMCIRENKKRDEMAERGEIPDYDDATDLTDKDDMYHRYSY